jgi:hypothetical protein
VQRLFAGLVAGLGFRGPVRIQPVFLIQPA